MPSRLLSQAKLIFDYVKHRVYNIGMKNSITKKNIVMFYMHPWIDVRSGGILSIFFLMDESKKMLPDFDVFPATLAKIPTYTKAKWFKNDFNIVNILYHKKQLELADNVLVHVPECFFELFCKNIQRFKLEHIFKKTTLNILNQNEDLMPTNEIILKYRSLFKKITMTLAFEANKYKSYSYLDHSPFLLSTWFYRNDPEKVPFESKENIAIISKDDHPLKHDIMTILSDELKIKCIEVINMPFEEYKYLQRKAKWSFSFGEGYDNFSIGPHFKGGVGFGVYNPTFFPSNITSDNLPTNFFGSYEEMLIQIKNVIEAMDNKDSYEACSAHLLKIASEHHSPEIVINNLKRYYKYASQINNL